MGYELNHLNLLNKEANGVEITVEDEHGEEKSFTVELSGDDQKLIYLSDQFTSDEQMPITYRNKAKELNYCYESDLDHHTMYFLYRSCADQENDTLADCFGEMIQKMTENAGYENLILDVQWNQGGNRFLMYDLINKYKEQLKEKKIAIIIGRSTYSAAFQMIGDYLDAFPNVKLYGQKTGQAIHHYTEIKLEDLTALNCWLQVPTKKNFQGVYVIRYGDINDGIEPDVTVTQTYQDYMEGVDTIYQKIIEDLAKEE